jgi:hypothetical protein
MKKLLTLALAALAVLSVWGQPASGKFFMGGSLSAYTHANKNKNGNTIRLDYSYTSISFLPAAGYFLSEKLAVGMQIGFEAEIYKYENNTFNKEVTTKNMFNPFARYYLTGGNGGVFLEGTVGMYFGNYKAIYDDRTDVTKESGISLYISPGLYYYITPRLALEAKFGRLGFQHDVSGSELDNTFGLSLSPESLSFGVMFTLK